MEKVIGIITNTHGIKGELRVKSLTDFNRFVANKQIYALVNDEKHYFTIQTVKNHNAILIVTFEGYDRFEDVLPFKGLTIYSDESVENQRLEDEFFYEELLNLVAVDEDDKVLGKVINVYEVPQGHMIVVLTDNGEKMIPFRKEFVGAITKTKIVIKPIEGLL